MRLPQLYKVLQDTNTIDELMLFIPRFFINHISCVLVKRPLYDGGYIFANRAQGSFQNVTIEKLALSHGKTIIQSKYCCI